MSPVPRLDADPTASALMRHLLEECGHLELLGVEGERHADWILLDFNAVVVHLMLEETRTYYDLEQL